MSAIYNDDSHRIPISLLCFYFSNVSIYKALFSFLSFLYIPGLNNIFFKG